MGILNLARGRRDDRIIAENNEYRDTSKDFEVSGSGSDSDTLSLEAKNEKEVQEHPDSITQHAQLGVKKAEATALVWSKGALYGTFAWIWLCFFILAFQQSIQTAASFNAYSDFRTAPALTTAQILGSIIGGVLKLPIAKVLNIWGRAEGLLIFFGVYLIGIIVLASSSGPDSYAAGYVLYWIGYDAIYLILDIFVADTSGLKNRALSWAFVSTPFIITAFTGPLASNAYLAGSTWRWAIGSFAVITPCFFVPLALVFKYYQRKAEKMGLFKKEDRGRTFVQSFVHYFHEFDIVGAILLMAAFVLFLLPFSLQSYGRVTFDSATFIAMIVVGVMLFPVFAAWEKWFARKHFVRWELLRDRTVIGACVLAAVSYYSFYSWDSQFYNFAKVVYALNIAEANYMLQIYNVGSTFWGVVFGIWIRWTKHFKYPVLFFGVPLTILGAGLMIHFRGNDSAIGYVVMCQIFIAFGGGTNVIGQNMAVMAAADRDGVPMMLSLLFLFSSIGGAIGQAVSTAIYSNTFPRALSNALPADLQNTVQTLYLGGYEVQEKYVPGTVLRTATNFAWGRTQYYGCISAVAVWVLGVPAVAVWKNYNVDKKQNKGTVI